MRRLLVGIVLAVTLGGCNETEITEAQMIAFCHPHHGVRSLQIFEFDARVICIDGTVEAWNKK